MTIQSLIDEAKERMFAIGTLAPMIYLELSQDAIIIHFKALNDKQSIPEQCGALARLAWETCKKYPGQQPVSISFSSEAWQVTDPENTATSLMPVKSYKRQEVIIVSLWHANNQPHVQTCALAILRDHKGRITDITQGEIEGRISYQLAALLQGARDAQKPDEEVLSRLQSSLEKRIAALPPEKQEELLDFLKHL